MRPNHVVCSNCHRRILPGDRYWAVDDTIVVIKLDVSKEYRPTVRLYCDPCGKDLP